MAALMMFLCTPAARMVNGAILVADAASTQHNWFGIEDLFDEVQAEFSGQPAA